MSKNTKNEEKHSIEVAHDDKVFASCTFETLGLHTRLCNILEGTNSILHTHAYCFYFVYYCMSICM